MLYLQLYEYLDGFTALDIDDIFNQIIYVFLTIFLYLLKCP